MPGRTLALGLNLNSRSHGGLHDADVDSQRRRQGLIIHGADGGEDGGDGGGVPSSFRGFQHGKALNDSALTLPVEPGSTIFKNSSHSAELSGESP